jgi:hypothetical protein
MKHDIRDKSQDREYFLITPQLVWALCSDPYEYTLWSVVKMIAGDDGECMLSTEQLAAMAMMSTGKVSECRKQLIAHGLLHGEVRQDPWYPHPVWHLAIPDLWARNLEWRQAHHSLLGRVTFKRAQRSLHVVKPSPDEGEREPSPDGECTSPGEGYPSPGETKKIQKEDPKEEPEVLAIWSRTLAELRGQFTRTTIDTWIKPIVPLSFDRAAGIIALRAHNEYAKDWLEHRLEVPIRRTLAGVVGTPMDRLTVVFQLSEDSEAPHPLREPEPATVQMGEN